MDITAIEILKLLRSWSSASLSRINEEINVSLYDLDNAINDLQEQGFVDLIGISKDADISNPLLHINGIGLAYLDTVEGNVDAVI
ncbi:hypothetical protein [Olivibacter sitiensis]|uniref:hypothetical protein n=1 Tax=Olivibacter sitiensis TaxID=376470 RepID=UPI000429B3D5|nr:hypothetical protein [Olivibacter sitiensis]